MIEPPKKPQADLPVAAMVRHCRELLRQRLDSGAAPAGLVVGCGNGNEVAYLRRAFDSRRVFGLDVERNFTLGARAERCVLQADARRLPFPSEVFDFAAAFHSLEHVGDAGQALDEICRVLRPGGWFYMGVPNRLRWVGYMGSADATTWQKITWNLADWKARAQGKFANELGAHAGFEREELRKLLAERFSSVEMITEDFIRFKYAGRLPQALLNMLLAPSIVNFTAPSHYAICRKKAA